MWILQRQDGTHQGAAVQIHVTAAKAGNKEDVLMIN
jgi:hypothetical protein